MRIVPYLILALLMAATPLPAADSPKALYEKTVERYPAPALKDVGGREYKFLVDASKMKGTPEAAFKELWKRIKTAAARNGFTVTEKSKKAFKVDRFTKVYYDTSDQALWKRGYLVRVTTKAKGGTAGGSAALTVKAIQEDAAAALAVPLAVASGATAKTEAEDNVGIGPGGELRGYVEKGSTVTVPIDSLGKVTLGDLGRFLPELLKLGLSADTPLVGTRVVSYRVKPGTVALPEGIASGIALEAWATREGEAPSLYDFSFGYAGVDFYTSSATHAAGEEFFRKVCQGDLADLEMPRSGKWGGSKVRVLMNRPIEGPPPGPAAPK
jgi:hypothetical protein